MSEPADDPIHELRGLPTPAAREGFWDDLLQQIAQAEVEQPGGGVSTPLAGTTSRPRRHRRLILLSGAAAALAFVAATAVGLDRRQAPSSTLSTPTSPTAPPAPVSTSPDGVVPSEPAEVLPAQNFLVTGQSAAPCVDAGDPTAGGFGAGNTDAHLVDTIMVLRVFPDSGEAAVLSFPRDLWVRIHGRNGSGRINSAFDPTFPERLIGTIADNFDIPIDHSVNVDMCAFKTIVDAVGGVNVPFAYTVWDRNVGLEVTGPACAHLDGDQALAWVRSRKLRYLDEQGEERQDATSDFGRIARQQDFLRRLASKAISEGLTRPDAAMAFIDAALDGVTTDSGLTVGKMLDLVATLGGIDPADVRGYQLDVVSEPHNGLSTLGLAPGSEHNEQVLALFQGTATLADLGVATDAVDSDAPGPDLPSTADPSAAASVVVPPDDPTCRP